MLGVERFAMRVDRLEVVALEGVVEHLQGQLDAFTHRLDGLVVGIGQFQAALQAVDDRQQVASELLQGELVGLLDVLLGATTHVLQVGYSAQGLILGGGQLLLELQNTGAYIRCTSLFGVKVFLIQLFVSHWVSPPQISELRARLAFVVGYMGPEKPASRAELVFSVSTESPSGHCQG
ncbi:hypothetical protein D3C79_612490 [compost metagenome]